MNVVVQRNVVKGHHVKLSDFDFFNDTLIVNWLLLFVVTFTV